MLKIMARMLFSALLLITGLGIGRAQSMLPPQPINCQALAETLRSPRWLGLPLSRLVVNPTYTYADNPFRTFVGDAVPTDLAYYAGALPVRLPGFLSWRLSALNNAPAGQSLDFESAHWKRGEVKASFTEGGVNFASTTAYGDIAREVTVDLDRTPKLLIQVAASSGAWALKVNDGQTVSLIADNDLVGAYMVDVAAKTGWHGTKTFSVEVWAIGGPGHDVTISGLQFLSNTGAAGPRQYVWQPQQLVTRAAAVNGTPEVEITTSLPDVATVAQRLRIMKAGGHQLQLTGQFAAGTMHWDAAQQTLLLQGDNYHAVLAFSRPVRWLGVRASALDFLDDEAGASAERTSGVWGLAIDGLKAGDEVIVAARFASTPTGTAATRMAVQAQATPAAFQAALARQAAMWNEELETVPHPLDFNLHALDAQGATAADVRRTYYRAWVFLLADVLPPMPENSFPYPQCACGKPSLWADGAPHSKASAQWESFLAMQALALVDPTTAWAAYQGQMTQLEADGSINGEGLPACHAQTAWVLYAATGDRAQLASVYPALKKLLQWKISDPRWIFHGATPAGLKDIEFVVHALTDISYAERIAQALHQPAEATFWQGQRQALALNFHRWFWQAPTGPLYRLNYADKGPVGAGDPWVLETLMLPPDILTAPQRDYLLKLFQATFPQGRRLRFPDYEYTWKGLLRYGQIGEVSIMADTGIRDITRAGEFSEDYGVADPPQPRGVRPSIFGSRHAIDDTLWHNGIIYDEGLPVLVGMPHAAGVTNLRVQGEPISVTFNADSSAVTLAGPGLSHLRLPLGFQVMGQDKGTPRWQGKIAAGQQIKLEQK